jgi:hypothetical protein
MSAHYGSRTPLQCFVQSQVLFNSRCSAYVAELASNGVGERTGPPCPLPHHRHTGPHVGGSSSRCVETLPGLTQGSLGQGGSSRCWAESRSTRVELLITWGLSLGLSSVRYRPVHIDLSKAPTRTDTLGERQWTLAVGLGNRVGVLKPSRVQIPHPPPPTSTNLGTMIVA